MGVSGELRYFGCSSAKERPAKATTLPLSLVIGKMTRRRKRSKWNLRSEIRSSGFAVSNLPAQSPPARSSLSNPSKIHLRPAFAPEHVRPKEHNPAGNVPALHPPSHGR